MTTRLPRLALCTAAVSLIALAALPSAGSSHRVRAAEREASSPSLVVLFHDGLQQAAAESSKPQAAGAAHGKAAASKKSTVPLPEGEGLELTKKMCSTCHGTDAFARQRHTREKWNQIMDNMVSKGMEATDDDMEKVTNYLAANLGPDSAPAADAAKPATSTAPPKQ